MNENGWNDAGNNGNYWSRTVNDAENAYDLNLNGNNENINPDNNDNKYNGFSVRCIAE